MTIPSFAPSCCSDLKLDRYRLQEMAEAEASETAEHLARSPPCAARLQRLVEQRARFVADDEVLVLTSAQEPRARPNEPSMPPNARHGRPPNARVARRSAVVWASSAGAFAAVAAAVLLWIAPESAESVRTKGGGPRATAELFVRRGDDVRSWQSLSAIRGGDVVRTRIDSEESVFAVVVELDEEGRRTLFAPTASGPLLALPPGVTELPFATTLDDRGTATDVVVVLCRTDVGTTAALRATTSVVEGCVAIHHRASKEPSP